MIGRRSGATAALLPAVVLILAGCGAAGTGSGRLAGLQPDSSLADLPTQRLGPTAPATVLDCMSEGDLEMLSRVNLARERARLCGERSFAPAPALAWNCTLQSAALAHARDMASNDFFGHTGSDGLQVDQRVGDLGYDWQRVGENLAGGQPSVAEAMQEWLQSPGHCANIMSPGFAEMGAAWAARPGTRYGIYWTQAFAAPR